MQTKSGGYTKGNTLLKITSIICLIIFIFALISTRNDPAKGYEASIYTSTPPIFWLAITLNVICGTTLIIQQIYTGEFAKSKLWAIGFLLIFLTFSSLVTVWIIRGYANYGSGDTFSHVGLTNYIISNNHTPPHLLYPITHILTAEIGYIFNIPVADFYGYIPFIFNIMFLIFTYVLARSILSSKGAVILTLTLAMVAILGFSNGNVEFAPNTLADLYLPFAIYLFVRSSPPRTIRWKILFLIVLFMYPLFHPVPTFALLLIMTTITLAGIFVAIVKKQDSKATQGSFNFQVACYCITSVWATTWLSSSGMLTVTINNLRNYFSGIGSSQIATLTQLMGKTTQYHYSVLSEFFKIYGGLVFFSLISLGMLAVMLKRTSHETEQKNMLSLYGPIAMLALFVVIFYLVDLNFSPLRLVAYIALIMAMLTGFGLNSLLKQKDSRPKNIFYNSVIISFVFLAIVVSFAGSALELYPSRYILTANDQVTRTDLQGMDWFFENENASYQISVLNMTPYRYANYLLGPQESDAQTNLTPVILEPKEGIGMPYHFGYSEKTELGEWYSQQSYLLLDQEDRLFFQDVLPEMQQSRFTPQDFDKLKQDPSLNLVYSNGGLDIYGVTPVN